MNSEFSQINNQYYDFFNEPSWRSVSLSQDDLESDNQQFDAELMSHHIQTKQDVSKKFPKLQKRTKIRTSRNVQKTYHNILKCWLHKKRLSWILPKYHRYYNQRVYFILVLEQIIKHADGSQFVQTYKKMANQVIDKKLTSIQQFDSQKPNSEQAQHLKRVIEEIQHSIKSCQMYVEGNLMESLIVVYKRNQNKISKKKQFFRAIDIFREVTGRNISSE